MYSFDRHNHIHNTKFSFATFFAATLAVLTLLFGLLLSGPQASADATAVVDIAVEISASCSIVASRESVSSTIIPGNSGGIGDTTIKAICNDPAGLAIYTAGYAGDTLGNNNLVNTVGGDDINIRTYVTASGTPPQSEWNMTINGITGTYAPTIVSEFDGAAHIIPQQYTKVAYRNAMTDIGVGATGAQFTAAFNAYIANDQASGTYTGKVKFLLIHPNLLDGSATQPNTIYIMQEVADWGDTITSGQTVTAMDERDGEFYTVARLADGNIWMTKNLRLNLARANITADNTDHPSAAFLTAISSKPASSNNWCSDYADSTCVDHVYYNTDNLGDYTVDSDSHIYDEYGAYYNWYTATAGNGTLNSPVETTVSGSLCPSGWHLPSGTIANAGPTWFWEGEYWALSAGLNGLTLAELTPDNYGPVMSSNTAALYMATPNNFLKSGLYGSSDSSGETFYNRGSAGYYWTSTTSAENYINGTRTGTSMLYLANDSIAAGYSYNDRNVGLTVRCIADYDPYYLQDVASWGDSVALNGRVIAVDRRDGQTYIVRRLKMNAAGTETALWMSNLNLGAKPLTVDNLDSTNTHLAFGVSAIPATTFMAWDRTTSGTTATYPDPKFTPITASNSATGNAHDGRNKYGTLYSYAAASAGTYTYGGGDGTGNATSDLCPSGWRLPTGGSSGELETLTAAYSLTGEINSTTYQTIANDLGFSFAGRFTNNSSPTNQGSRGHYWTSTFYNEYNMYVLSFNSSILPTDPGNRSHGQSIRCIAQ